ncbi:MAG: histidinol-phosphate aminotransferase family protein [Deltaproteobacteria bacterium]|nr:histidinol-phosphate aminotransferase family protein [Deltaproteobacteria bacterium]
MTSTVRNPADLNKEDVDSERAGVKRVGVPNPTQAPKELETCPHGGRVYDTVGQDFTKLEALDEVLAADVLDAWYPPAPAVLKKLSDNLAWCARTSPPVHAEGLRGAIAASRNIQASQIVLGCGSSDLIFRVVPKFLAGEGPIVIPQPSYAEYRHVLTNLHGREVLPFYTDESDFILDVDALAKFAKASKASAICLVNPCNPTGFALPKDKMIRLLDSIGQMSIVVDETYIDYIGKGNSIESCVEQYPNLMVLKSVSKFYALSGMRIGYAVAAVSVAKQFQIETPPYIVSTPGQMAAIAAFEAEDYYLDRVEETHRLREGFSGKLRSLPGLRVMPSNINCLLLDLKKTGWTAAEFLDEMVNRKLLCRDIGHQGLSDPTRYVRVAVLSQDANDKMVAMISAVILSKHDVGAV